MFALVPAASTRPKVLHFIRMPCTLLRLVTHYRAVVTMCTARFTISNGQHFFTIECIHEFGMILKINSYVYPN
jgi:hypothetical protein